MFKNFLKKNKLEAIKRFQDKNDLLITYEQLENIPLNKMIQIVPDLPGAIECTRISSNKKDSLMFTVTMKKNQLWEKHHHDCEETCVIYKGKLTDILTDYSVGSMQMLNYKPYTSHYIIAEEDSIFYVEFKKPNK